MDATWMLSPPNPAQFEFLPGTINEHADVVQFKE